MEVARCAQERAIFEYVPEGWERQRADPRVKGWADQTIEMANRVAWPQFSTILESTSPLAINPETPPGNPLNIPAQMQMISFCYAVALAARGLDRLSILDFGGAAGQHAAVARRMVPGIKLDYFCADLPGLCTLGREINPEVTFIESESDFANLTCDMAIASGSLQYVEDWRSLLAKLADRSRSFLYVARIPIVETVPSYVMVHRPYAFGYDTEYLSWCHNRSEFLRLAEQHGMKLFREFLGSDSMVIKDAPEQCQFRGFLFQRSL